MFAVMEDVQPSRIERHVSAAACVGKMAGVFVFSSCSTMIRRNLQVEQLSGV